MELKRSIPLYVLWALVLGGLGFLVYTHRVEWTTAAGYLVALGLPSLLGKKVEP